MPNNFNHLHVHTIASILDSTIKIDALLDKVEALGQKAVAITNSNNLYDAINFYQKAKKRDIKPILGCEFSILDDMMEKSRGTDNLTILAMNNEGWNNLKKLLTIANRSGYYYNPRIDYKTLFQHSAGLICLSGDIRGRLSKLILEDKINEAKEFCLVLKDAFQDRFYIEIMDMDISGQQLIKKHLREIAFKLSIPEVATCDVHYLNQDDSYLHEVVLAINSRKKISDTSRFTYPTNEFWLKDYDSLKDLFTSSEISTTLEIAERCNVDIDFESTKIPRYPRLPEGVSSYDYLRDLIYKGFEFRGFSLDNKEYVDRIKMELADIKEAELADYFLILHDIIVWAKDSGIWVGPGRGSAGGSLIAYVLRITEIDPLEYGLLWERFYNVGRKGSMPDIDTDVEIDRREDVLDYIRNTFGENYVCQMITFNTLSTKAILKDIGKVFDIDFKIMNDITDQVPKKVKNLADALEQSELLQESEKKYKKIFVIAKELEGIIKSVGTHAAAVVISNQDIYQGCLPLHWDAGNKKMVTGCSMYCLDDLKYLKLDVLGLKTLSVLKMAERLVNEKNKNSDGEQ